MKISKREYQRMYEILIEEIPNAENCTIACYTAINKITQLLEGRVEI